jgi:hypothetical protein
LRTIDGGPEGLRYVSRVIEIASTLKTKLAFITGSYSNPVEVFRLLEAQGYRVKQLTLSVLRFGAFSEANKDQILKLEAGGKAFLLRKIFEDQLAYFAIGVIAELGPGPSFSSREAEILFSKVKDSTTTRLEKLSNSSIPIRVLVLNEQP